MKALRKLASDLGSLGFGCLAVLAACAAFHIAFVAPLEREKARLDTVLLETAPRPPARPVTRPDAARVADFYRFFEHDERIDQSLARLYGIASASGLDLRTAEYRLAETRHRFQRYEISLPVRGSYGQVRLFIESSLRELPTLSLDRANLRRKSAGEHRIEADLVLTLHRLQR